jgi:hypothetical protein
MVSSECGVAMQGKIIVERFCMKRFLFITKLLICFAVLISCASSPDYPQPVFDKAKGYVIDAYAVAGKFEDYVKIHNSSSDSNMTFNIYVHNRKTDQWLMLGPGFLKDNGDTDTIDTNIDDLDRYRYFAIESMNDKDYNISVSKGHNDLHIYFSDK